MTARQTVQFEKQHCNSTSAYAKKKSKGEYVCGKLRALVCLYYLIWFGLSMTIITAKCQTDHQHTFSPQLTIASGRI